VFARLIAIYGSQKVGAMWSGSDFEEVLATWDEGLAGYRFKAVDGALRSLITSESQWPPNLPEFVAIVRQLQAVIRRREMDARALSGPPAPRRSPLMPPDKARVVLAHLSRLAQSKRVH
jgi:hypothetical protein